MVDLIALEKEFLHGHIKRGGVAVDFTMGNGNDTLWLANEVGAEGKVYAFDIQEQALNSTHELLLSADCPRNYTLILDSHANVKKYVTEKICVGVFNLGYLPRSDKSITTMRPSTLAAVTAAIELLDSDGIVLIAVYPGHAEGTAEGLMLDDELAKYDRRHICVSKFRIINSPTSPYFFAVESK